MNEGTAAERTKKERGNNIRMDGLKMFARVAKDHPWILDRETLRDEIITKTDDMEIHTFVYHTGKEMISYDTIETPA